MRALCFLAIALCVAAVHVAALDNDLLAKGDWSNTKFAAAPASLTYLAAAVECSTVDVDGKKGDSFSSPGGTKCRRLSAASETWMVSAFDKVVAQVKEARNTVDHKRDWCLTFHCHVYKKGNDLVFIFHNREYCALTDKDVGQVTAVWPDARLLGMQDTHLDKTNLGTATPACTNTCKVKKEEWGAVRTHLMVYSTADAKLYYWGSYKKYLQAFKAKCEKTVPAAMVASGGVYAELFTDSVLGGNGEFASPTYTRIADITVTPTAGQAWVRAKDADFDKITV